MYAKFLRLTIISALCGVLGSNLVAAEIKPAPTPEPWVEYACQLGKIKRIAGTWFCCISGSSESSEGSPESRESCTEPLPPTCADGEVRIKTEIYSSNDEQCVGKNCSGEHLKIPMTVLISSEVKVQCRGNTWAHVCSVLKQTSVSKCKNKSIPCANCPGAHDTSPMIEAVNTMCTTCADNVAPTMPMCAPRVLEGAEPAPNPALSKSAAPLSDSQIAAAFARQAEIAAELSAPQAVVERAVNAASAQSQLEGTCAGPDPEPTTVAVVDDCSGGTGSTGADKPNCVVASEP